jgi:hypothetical protein
MDDHCQVWPLLLETYIPRFVRESSPSMLPCGAAPVAATTNEVFALLNAI